MRSFLFVPGDSERKLFKSLQSEADAVVIDLEDSVSPDKKASARTLTAGFLADIGTDGSIPRYYVRINDLQTGYWQDDLDAVINSNLKGIMQPKTRSGADVTRLCAAIAERETRANIKTGSKDIIIIATEQPISLLNMSSYVDCSPRLTGISWGAEDLSTAIGANAKLDERGEYTPPIELARSLCLYAAGAASVQAVDTVYTDFKDLEGLAENAARAARDGFTGKEAVHPAQVPIINEAFTPSEREIEEARIIVKTFEEHKGEGVISFHDQMMDRPHLIHAKRVLERAEFANSRKSES